jgi:hypothetical protein
MTLGGKSQSPVKSAPIGPAMRTDRRRRQKTPERIFKSRSRQVFETRSSDLTAKGNYLQPG